MNVTINPFSENSLTEAINALTDYCEFVSNEAPKAVVEELIEIGKEEAISRIAPAVATHAEPLPTVWIDGEGNERRLHTDEAGVFYEFGTGVTRAGWSGDSLPSGIVPHGEFGKGLGANPNGWIYMFNGQKLHTFGIDAVNFMWFAAKEMRKKASAIARKKFKWRSKK